ncbi:cation efflux protein [Dichomitus squalens LYAD-421 SS1]|uniref:Cation efflux protein n=1 Tax=Dichomitus squalens (strain LYAD-421) TaxID=732165 RepID=R7SZG2_DICSQ|nr:cation efflux protein [Dichomitus squalens LYAD-421 SS1]EJF60357.1 cation efflux protein [Dichomitus squalens LYAD-421 SS1]
MSTLTTRRAHSTQSKGKGPEGGTESHDHDHSHDAHSHAHSHTYSHSHGFFRSLVHRHDQGEDGHAKDPEQIVQALKGEGTSSSHFSLTSNVVLTGAKGAAGWYMNSAALLADAGHCLGDLIRDFITLFSWRLSRQPPSERYPYGYGKFEVLGTTVVSILLTGGALGIGLHSWTLLMEVLSTATITMGPGPLHDVLARILDVAQAVPSIAAEHAHVHSHGDGGHGDGLLDPNVAWFAGVSVVAKEWLYRITKRVADEERSLVLLANAVHHRSDAFGSAVAFVAILGNWWFPQLPLDPIGGLIVSVLIFQQGWGLLKTAFCQLTDAGVSPRTKAVLFDALRPLLPSSSPSDATLSDGQSRPTTQTLLGISDLRVMRTGANMFVDLTAHVPAQLSVNEATAIEQRIRDALVKVRRDVKEVRVRFCAVASEEA